MVVKRKEAIICCDINTNILPSNSYTSKYTDKYANYLISYNFHHWIDKTTRVTYQEATIINHISTNLNIGHRTSGILYNDISDHFPLFDILNYKVKGFLLASSNTAVALTPPSLLNNKWLERIYNSIDAYHDFNCLLQATKEALKS